MARECGIYFMASRDQKERQQTMQGNAEPEAERKDEDEQGQAKTRGGVQEQGAGEAEREGDEAREEKGEEGGEALIKFKGRKASDDLGGGISLVPYSRSRSPRRLVQINTAFCDPTNPDFRNWDPSPITIKSNYLRDWLGENRPDVVLNGKVVETYFHPTQLANLWNEALPRLKKNGKIAEIEK